MSIISTSSILSASGKGRIDPFAGDELTDPRHQFQAFFADKEIDECFAGTGMRRLGADGYRLSVAHEFAQPHVIQRNSLFTVEHHVFKKGDAYRSFAGGNPFSRRSQRFDQ